MEVLTPIACVLNKMSDVSIVFVFHYYVMLGYSSYLNIVLILLIGFSYGLDLKYECKSLDVTINDSDDGSTAFV